MSEKMFIIGQRMRSLIKQSGIEQGKVANALGINVTTFSGYVNCSRNPPPDVISDFAKHFDVTIDYLYGNTNIPNNNLAHLSDKQKEFVNNPENTYYIDFAIDMKEKVQAKVESSLVFAKNIENKSKEKRNMA